MFQMVKLQGDRVSVGLDPRVTMRSRVGLPIGLHWGPL